MTLPVVVLIVRHVLAGICLLVLATVLAVFLLWLADLRRGRR
jgi:hypothetical protein